MLIAQIASRAICARRAVSHCGEVLISGARQGQIGGFFEVRMKTNELGFEVAFEVKSRR